jgi:hypothetical protein
MQTICQNTEKRLSLGPHPTQVIPNTKEKEEGDEDIKKLMNKNQTRRNHDTE